MAYQRIITVRMPPALHEALKRQAYEGERSLNELCIERLLVGTGLEIVHIKEQTIVQAVGETEKVA